MYVVGLLSATVSLACGGAEPPPEAPPAEVVLPPFECTQLQGMYRIVYAKRSGDCADLPEQLAFFDDRPNSSALHPDCQATVTTSDDDCDREEDAVCPIVSDDRTPLGNAKLLTAFTQTSESRIEGMATIELSTTAGTGCTATYALIGSKVE